MFLKRSEESYGNVRLNGEKVDFDSWDGTICCIS